MNKAKHEMLEKMKLSVFLMLFMNVIFILSTIRYNKINYISLAFYFIALITNIYYNIKLMKEGKQ